MREKRKVLEAEKRLFDIVWWNRHSILEQQCKQTGKFPSKDIWDKALENAARIEKKFPKRNYLRTILNGVW